MKKIRNTIKRGINGFRSFKSPFMQKYPPGHFYSPIPQLHEALSSQQAAYAHRFERECPGVDLQEQEQLSLLDKFRTLYVDFDLPEQPQESYRYYFANGFFPGGDAVILYSIMRHFKPRHIIEVGSGFSSAAMLDINEKYMGKGVRLQFIEPYPDRLYYLLSESDLKRNKIYVQKLQNTELAIFDDLRENDILFIDSSHVLRIGSDVMYLLFNILPHLNPGVVIHIHDIPWPFEYPREYIMVGRAWNEVYALRAFLQYNNHFKILFFNSYMHTFYGEELRASMPIFASTPSSSIWIQKAG